MNIKEENMKSAKLILNMCMTLLVASYTATAMSESTKFTYESATGFEAYSDIFKKKSVPTTTLHGKLTLPDECSQSGYRAPAVIIQHGSGPPRHTWYKKLSNALADAGIAALVPNSFSGRGIDETASNQKLLSKADRIYDTFAAFRALGAEPCIDPDRIGITGYSFGGLMSREVVESKLAERLGGGHVFKASLPVYPSCQSRWEESRPTNTRVHFLLAEKDNYTPISFCLDHIPKLESAGWNITHSILRKAHHGFIASYSPKYYNKAWTFKDCGTSNVTPEGYETSVKYGFSAGKDMSWNEYIRAYAKKCATRGVTIGGTRKIRSAAMKFTVEFFSEHL